MSAVSIPSKSNQVSTSASPAAQLRTSASPAAQLSTSASPAAQFDALVVGAGFAGLYALHRLRGLGLRVHVFEAGSGIGGTWFWNRYPGARCDVESMEYSYSFSEELQQEWEWSERYATQAQILQYIHHVAERFDLLRDIQLNTRIASALFDSAANCWRLTTDKGEQFVAPYCIMATGNLSTPRVPAFKGLENFQGKWYHTGQWPHQAVDFTGQRVAVIGTGSSAIQAIPIIAQQAKHLHVFQRTANFSVPAHNGALDPQKVRAHKAEYPRWRRAAYDTPFGIAGYPPPTKRTFEASEEERENLYKTKWTQGGTIGFLYSYTDLLLDQKANDTVANFFRRQVRSIVHDAKTAELLSPKDHPIGTKRLCLDSHYYETYNRDNVTLVDARSAPIEEITQTGLRTRDGEYEFDAIVFATGFDAMTGALAEIDIRTDAGANLREHWVNGPTTYLGIMVTGLPNMFLITGPGSPGVKSNMIVSIEQHVNWIADCLAYMRTRGVNRIEAEANAEAQWTQHVADVANGTLYPLANSWYMGANIPGKVRVFMPYVGGVQAYKKRCDDVARDGYPGFALRTVRLAQREIA